MTAEQLTKARELRTQGKTFQAIAELYGVSRQAVHRALKKERNKPVGRPRKVME